jgi:hypothetical protein
MEYSVLEYLRLASFVSTPMLPHAEALAEVLGEVLKF